MSDRILILPAAGSATRLPELNYPKELLATGSGRLLIDSSLILAKNAGITRAVIVVSADKLKLMSAVLGPERCGLNLTYVVAEKDVVKSEAGAILRGCRRMQLAQYGDRAEYFAVAFPDVLYSDDMALSRLLEGEENAFSVLGTSKVQLAAFDLGMMARLRRLLMSSTTNIATADNAFTQIVQSDIKRWNLTDYTCDVVDVDTWPDFLEATRMETERDSTP